MINWWIVVVGMVVTIIAVILVWRLTGDESLVAKRIIAIITFIVPMAITVLLLFLFPVDMGKDVPTNSPSDTVYETANIASGETKKTDDNTITDGDTVNEVTEVTPIPRDISFDIWNTNEVNNRIIELNDELAGEAVYINPEVLRKLIYGLNGEYSEIKDISLEIIEPLLLIANVDNTVACNLPVLEEMKISDDRTPLESVQDIFSDKRDAAFVKSFETKRNEIINLAYETRDMEVIRPYINNIFKMYVLAFVLEEPIETELGQMRASSINIGARLFVITQAAMIMQMAVNYGEGYEVTIDSLVYSVNPVAQEINRQYLGFISIIETKIQD